MDAQKEKNLIVVCGPTASGKTRLGVQIALLCQGEIISCDSRQVYRGMDIGTGKDRDEYHTPQGEVPVHLIDIADPREIYTVQRYQADFARVFAEITARGRLPVVVGGTGLYLEAVLRRFDIPDVPENVDLRAELMLRDKDDLDRELLRIDPERHALTDRSSKKRIVRALEIIMAGRSIHDAEKPPLPKLHPLILCVTWERARLRQRIRRRLLERLGEGMVDEVRRLIASGIPQERFSLFGMEYKHVARYLRGEVDYEHMVEELSLDIGRLAKRQETWFRGMERRGVAVERVEEGRTEVAEEVLAQFSFDSENR